MTGNSDPLLVIEVNRQRYADMLNAGVRAAELYLRQPQEVRLTLPGHEQDPRFVAAQQAYTAADQQLDTIFNS